MKRSYVIVGVGICVVGLLLFYWFKKPASGANANSITTAPVSQSVFTKNIQSSGKTKAAKSVELKFQTSGRLAWVGVKEGDHVNAYQAIAGMDTREVQKSLEKTLRDYSQQRNTFEQTWRDNWPGAAESHESLDHAPNDAIKHILESNQWNLEKSVLDVELKNLSVEYSTLVTPIAGIVSHIDTPIAGVNVTPATSTFEIVDPESLAFRVNVDEIDVGNLNLGQKAEIRLDAFPTATFSGTITYISYASETSAGGATIFPVDVTFDSPQKLRIGLNGDVSIESVRIENALMVPTEAIREDATGKYVYRKTGTTYTRVPVTIGLQNESSTVINTGVSTGDSVVIKGFSAIPKK
jgi:RND family efflux transporter MFP subunit